MYIYIIYIEYKYNIYCIYINIYIKIINQNQYIQDLQDRAARLFQRLCEHQMKGNTDKFHCER